LLFHFYYLSLVCQ